MHKDINFLRYKENRMILSFRLFVSAGNRQKYSDALPTVVKLPQDFINLVVSLLTKIILRITLQGLPLLYVTNVST